MVIITMIDQITIRLRPGQDLKKEIENMASNHSIKAGIVASIVGSLNKAILRMADGKSIKEWAEELEIVSGTGTVSQNGSHVHISFSDKEGRVLGGHLKEGCIINTTAEIVVLIFTDAEYQRLPDLDTDYNELSIIQELK